MSRLIRNRQQEFLLSFFDRESYQEKFVKGFWLVKLYNGNTKKWQVAIYTKGSFENYKKYNENKGKIRRQEEMEFASKQLENTY